MFDKEYIYIDCENFEIQEVLNSRNVEILKRFVGKAKLIIFDEAQKVQYIGIALKLLHDHLPSLKIIATGSSSFERANKLSEPLTGRNVKLHLFPLSLKEITGNQNMFEISSGINNILRFGTYPDIYGIGEIRKPQQFKDLIITLAYLIGQTVTYSDIAKKLETDRGTVQRYMHLLEKTFIIKILRPLHRSHVREILHPFKIYFWDLGVRNFLVEDFKPIKQRIGGEIGSIWENFCIIERIKKNEYGEIGSNSNYGINKNYYFWRTKESSPKEYDLIEDYNGHFDVFEMKYNLKKEKSVKKYDIFFKTYPNSTLNIISQENWWEWLV